MRNSRRVLSHFCHIFHSFLHFVGAVHCNGINVMPNERLNSQTPSLGVFSMILKCVEKVKTKI